MAKLYVIAGHGGSDPGAGGGGYTEHERVVALAKEIVARGGGQVDHWPYESDCYSSRGMDWINPGCPIVELHMDSANGNARGAHVIIAAGAGGADSYDRAIANGIGALLPGRSALIVERDNLRNPNAAKRRGLNYRLVENGFIDNATDRGIFNSNIGKLADLYLSAFGINPNPERTIDPACVRDLQTRLTKMGFNPGPVDGVYGEETKRGVRQFQQKYGLDVDGDAGAQTMAAMHKRDLGMPLRVGDWFGTPNNNPQNHSGYYDAPDKPYVKMIQKVVGARDIDGLYGDQTKAAVMAWQKKVGLYVDGIFGVNSWNKAFSK